MFSKTIRKAALVLAAPVLLVGFAAPAAAQSSLSSDSSPSLVSENDQLSSRYTQEQGLFSQHTLALLGAHFSSDLTEEQRNALWFGPTDEEKAFECREKYGLNGDGPWPDIEIRTDCSPEVIDVDLYDEAVDIALAAPFQALSGSSSSS